MSRSLRAARRIAHGLRWLVDWRLYATFAASVVAGVLVFVVVDSSIGRHDALEALRAQAAQSIDIREAQSRRIDVLQEQIGELTSQIIALRDQLTAAGVTPVVNEPARPRLTPERPTSPTTSTTRAQPQPQPPPSTTSTTQPPEPPPPPCTTVPVLGRCV